MLATVTTCVVTYVALALSTSSFPPLAWLLSTQAGLFLSTLATFAVLGGRALWRVSSWALIPVLGLLDPPRLTPQVTHDGRRGVLDQQAGFLAQGLLYVFLGIRAYGFTAVQGWPFAVLGLLVSLLARPWLFL